MHDHYYHGHHSSSSSQAAAASGADQESGVEVGVGVGLRGGLMAGDEREFFYDPQYSSTHPTELQLRLSSTADRNGATSADAVGSGLEALPE